MNKYTELSDFKINRRIAVMIHKYSDFIEQYDNKTIYVDGNIFDPCKNPADAMPIIIENGISMVRVNNTWSARKFNNHCIEINGDNYFRIAMEVYLLMNGK
ncbi:phage protein NinX family protein [Providencia alcalifaciens]|uniref:phage protein NinX family protein n=1 Tax=Providencia alcalifaciens TaxID=126385 RepID=UPI0032DAB812